MRTQAHHRGKGKAAVKARLSTAKDARKGLAASTCTNAAEAMLRHQEECTMGAQFCTSAALGAPAGHGH